MAIASPARKTVKFISYNSTGLGPVKTQWIRNLMETVDAQFCGLQEHFKKTKDSANNCVIFIFEGDGPQNGFQF